MESSDLVRETDRAAWRCAGAVSAATLAVIAATVVAVGSALGGSFFYTLDDPYIHLQLARTIALDGTYGLAANEPSSPSSSILWPLLLVPFAGSAWAEYVPLVIGTVAVIAIPFAIAGGLSRAVVRVGLGALQARNVLCPAIIVGTLIANPVGLVMTGMEHPLQVLLAAAVGSGLVALASGAPATPWLALALAIGPLVRFENAALIVAAAPLLIATGRWRMLLGVVAASAVATVAFAAFLVAQGLDPLPSSVIEKSHLESGWLAGRAAAMSKELGYVPLWALLALVPLALVLMRGVRDVRLRLLLLGCIFVVPLHLAGGRVNWGARYEVYVFAFTAPAFAYALLWRRVATGLGSRGFVPAAIIAAMTVGAYALDGVLDAPARARAVNAQPAQLARFVTEHWRAAVAVNDIGLVTWRGGGVPVLDLIGLSSRPVRRARSGVVGESPATIDALARAMKVQVALFYPAWMRLHLPPGWIPVARMTMSGGIGNLGGRVVAIHATVPEAVEPLRVALRNFAVDLPPETRLVFETAAR